LSKTDKEHLFCRKVVKTLQFLLKFLVSFKPCFIGLKNNIVFNPDQKIKGRT
jgi:hypothetical protein